MVHHSEDKINRVIYIGDLLEEYCAVSGATLFSGKSDLEVTLKSDVTQLRSFTASDGTMLVAAGMGRTGEVQILDGLTLTCQL